MSAPDHIRGRQTGGKLETTAQVETHISTPRDDV